MILGKSIKYSAKNWTSSSLTLYVYGWPLKKSFINTEYLYNKHHSEDKATFVNISNMIFSKKIILALFIFVSFTMAEIKVLRNTLDLSDLNPIGGAKLTKPNSAPR